MIRVVDWAGRQTLYSYDETGNLVKIVRADGSVQLDEYDANNRIISRKDTAPNGMLINSYSYTYNATGDVTVETSIYENDKFISHTVTMTYDRNNRLLTYNGQEIKYDADGNMVSGVLNGEETEFVYDIYNRLINAGGTSYIYDAEGTRISQTNGEQTVTYVTDASVRNSRVLAALGDNDSTYYVYGMGLISQSHYYIPENGIGTREDYKTYHYDMRGSTTALTDKNGNMTDRFDYDTYGALYYRTGTTETPFLYTGQYGVMTDDNGLYYMRTRYYSPELKRFVNADILKGGIEDSRTLNRYAYVNGNPVSYIDPFGTSAELGGDSYLAQSFRQVWYGNYTEDVTAAGTAGQVLLGLVGADLPADIRDIYYDITHAEGTWESFGQGVVDTAALLPIVGGLKYIDEGAALLKGAAKSGDEIADAVKTGSSQISRKQAFRQAKEAAGIPKSAQYKTHKFVYDGSSENRIVYEFDVDGELKYIIEHPFDKMGRGNHFHVADASKGSPFNKGRYNQYDGHFPEDFNGFY